MSISYKPLWRVLVEKDMKKLELRDLAGISNGTLSRLGKNQPVTMEALEKICIALDCRVEDILEFVKD